MSLFSFLANNLPKLNSTSTFFFYQLINYYNTSKALKNICYVKLGNRYSYLNKQTRTFLWASYYSFSNFCYLPFRSIKLLFSSSIALKNISLIKSCNKQTDALLWTSHYFFWNFFYLPFLSIKPSIYSNKELGNAS